MLTSPRDIRAIDAIIDSLGYEYTRFDVDDFVHYIESLRRHEILVNHIPLDSDLFGIWCPALNRDYVFINDRLYVAHRIHSLLHEIAHMVLDHQGQDLRKVLPPELLEALGISPERGHLRGVSSGTGDDSPEDKEAEIFVSLIRRRLTAAQR